MSHALECYRLTSALVAIKGGPTGVQIITIHAGTIVTLTGIPQQSGLVDVRVGAEILSMFMRDLEERAEVVNGSGA